MSFDSNSFAASFTNHFVRAAALALFAIGSSAHATLYWDADSNLGGNGAWDINTTQDWSTANAAGAPNSTWTPNDGTQDAVFNGGASYTVTIPSGTTINAHSLSFGITAGNTKITGGTAINISDPLNSIIMNTNTSGAARTQIIQSPISGTDITVVPNATGSVNSFLTLGANPSGPANTFTGSLIFGGATTATGLTEIAIDNPLALPATATVKMRRNNAQLLFGGGGGGQTSAYTATFNNSIILNDGVAGTLTQSIGAFSPSSVITLGGVISGNAGLTFQLGTGGGQGKIILMNQETYTGPTQINTGGTSVNGIIALGVDNAFPIGTTFTETKGNFDMAGHAQQVGGLAGTGVSGVVSNTSATTSTLTISGNVIGDYVGIIGATSSSTLPGSNDNIALALAPTNTGSLSLSKAAGSTYNGGTTISGGKLYANNDANATGSATGTGIVTVNGTGFLAGSGSIGGAITVGSGGHLSAGQRTGNLIGTLIAFNSVSLSSGSNLDIDVGAPAPSGGASDQVSLNGFFGNFPLTVPAAAHSVGVNFSDPNGGAAGNGTYTLMTFQAGQYTGSTNASQFFTAASPTPNSLNGATIAYHLADSSNTNQDGNPAAATRLIAIVSGGPNALLWTGGAGNGNWDTGINANFTNLGTNAATTFAGNDNVTFDDTGANTDPVTIAAGGVQPNIVTINNSTAGYSFSGGDIKGSSVGGTGGGLFLKGTAAVTINSNYTAAGAITSSKTGAGGTATINGNITAATSLTLNSGTLTLAGANTYPGANTVNGGTLAVSGSSATFGHGDLNVTAGHAAIAAGVSDAIFNSAKVTLAGGGTANMADIGYIDLAAGINETVGTLILGTTTEPSGTYGATGSGATNIFNEYFSGAGIITVAAAALAGDYNHNGVVDAADYVAWRNDPASNGGTPGGYNTWRANFGATAGSGAALPSVGPQSAAVPEPASLILLMLTVASGCLCRFRAV